MEFPFQYRSSVLSCGCVLLAGLLAGSGAGFASAAFDRVAAWVNEEVITQSDIEAWIAYRGLPEPVDKEERFDLSLTILNLLVDQKLIRREADNTPFIVVTEAEVEDRLRQFDRKLPSGETLRERLAALGLTAVELRLIAEVQLKIAKFIELRFEPFIIVLPEEIEKYYQEVLLPEFQQTDQVQPSLELVEENIRQILGLQKAQAELDRWVQNERRKTNITILLDRGPSAAPNVPREFRDGVTFQDVPISKKLSSNQ